MELDIPSRLGQSVVDICGDAGRLWLTALPSLLNRYASRWSLQIGAPRWELTYNYVAPAVRTGGQAAVLKAAPPYKWRDLEVEALLAFDGRGAARVLEADRAAGVFLIERVLPGQPLSDLATAATDEEATEAGVALMEALWRPAPAGHSFPTTAYLVKALERLRARYSGATGPLDPALVRRAEQCFPRLAGDTLLHGDLHHGNILRGRQGWLTIDPSAAVGAPIFDAATFVNSRPNALTDVASILSRRIERLSGALDFDPDELREAAIAQSILSACWSIEDHDAGYEQAAETAAVLASL